MLFDRTAGTIRTELTARLPDAKQRVPILAATYVEVWWLAGCHRGAEFDVTHWIRGILDRRIADAHRATGRQVEGDPRPSRSELELAAGPADRQSLAGLSGKSHRGSARFPGRTPGELSRTGCGVSVLTRRRPARLGASSPPPSPLAAATAGPPSVNASMHGPSPSISCSSSNRAATRPWHGRSLSHRGADHHRRPGAVHAHHGGAKVCHRDRSALRLLPDPRPDSHYAVSVHVDTANPAEPTCIGPAELTVRPPPPARTAWLAPRTPMINRPDRRALRLPHRNGVAATTAL